jgi:hypothetical protein
MLIAGIVVGAVAVVFALVTAWKYTHPEPPKIVLSPDNHNFGKLAEGVKVKHAFQIQNKGGSTLVIKEAKPTCDCTTVKLDKTEVPGGKSTDLEVTVDTTMKMGEIKKEILISTNDPLHSQSKVTVIAQVDPHAGMSAIGPSKLFSAKCGVCHVTPGIGKLGEDLYLADCAMCHGFRADGKGAPAPSLVGGNLEDKAVRASLREITAFGNKTNPTAMPGFIKEKGGPLTGAEIDSLVEYLRWRKSIR